MGATTPASPEYSLYYEGGALLDVPMTTRHFYSLGMAGSFFS